MGLVYDPGQFTPQNVRNCGLTIAFRPGFQDGSPVSSNKWPRSVRRSATDLAPDSFSKTSPHFSSGSAVVMIKLVRSFWVEDCWGKL